MMDLEVSEQRGSNWVGGGAVDRRSLQDLRGTRLRALRPWSALLFLLVLTAWPLGPLSAAEVTDANVDQMLAAAKTPEDHQALAAYFNNKAAQAAESAKMHERMLASFTGKPADLTTWKTHCNGLIRAFRNQQHDYQALAKEQETIAKTLSGAHK